MPDNKLTDKEIIKALDICSKSTNGCSHSKYTCKDCYLNGQPMCSAILLQDAIDLFDRLQAENDEMFDTLDYRLKKILELEDNLKIAEAENENYSKNNQQMTSDILKLYKKLEQAKAENERLKREIEDLESVQEISPEAKYLVDTKADKVISLLTELNKSQEQIKAEAYKEIAEMLHEELRIYGIKDKFNKAVFLNIVDKAKKELVGDNE